MLGHVNRSGALAIVALVASLASSSYAAGVVLLPPASVGSTQLTGGAVTAGKIAAGAATTRAVRDGTLLRGDLAAAASADPLALGAQQDMQEHPERAAPPVPPVPPVSPGRAVQRALLGPKARPATKAQPPSQATSPSARLATSSSPRTRSRPARSRARLGCACCPAAPLE